MRYKGVMRCPICDAHSTFLYTEKADHTRLRKYKCDLCGLSFNTYEVYTSQNVELAEANAMAQSKIMQCVFAREEKK